MFGIEDPGVWTAYLLCVLSAILCVIYGLIGWNRASDAVEPVDVTWAAHEEQAKQDL